MAIADPTRRQILELLNHQGATAAGEIAAEFPGLSRPAVSRHLRILRECELVTVTRTGKAQNYRVNPEPLSHVRSWAQGFAGRQTASLRTLRGIIRSDSGHSV